MINQPEVPTACGACCTRLKNIHVSFGKKHILENINLHIHCGQLAVIIGPNGGGKTTLLRAILGEVPHTGIIETHPLGTTNRNAIKIGYVPQRLDLDRNAPMTVLDLFAATLSPWPVWMRRNRFIRTLTNDALAKVRVEASIDERLGTLSGGQLQRVLLALALTPIPDLLLLDEPVSGVDPSGVDLFYRMVSELRHTFHLAVVLVSHDCAIAARYADRMLFLNRSIQCDGTPEEVLRNDVVVKTFGAIPFTNSNSSKKSSPCCIFTESNRT